MINIFIEKSKLIIDASDDIGKQVLLNPLHRVYLRSRLGSLPDKTCRKWSIPLGEKNSDIINKIITHFVRYNILYKLDAKSKSIIKATEEKRKEFEKRLKDSLKSKRKISIATSNNIKQTLGVEFKRKLTKLQLSAVSHLLTIGNGANFSVPGSGKTTIALAYYNILHKQNKIKGLFVIGPASCFGPWEYEYEQCFGKKAKCVRVAGKTKRERQELYLSAKQYEILLTTYHSAVRDVNEISQVLRRKKYLVVLDESHYIKRPQGGKIANAILQIAKYASQRIILTGTPMPNGLADLWSQFTYLWFHDLPLGTADSYLRQLQEKNQEIVFRSVKNKVSPLFFRITKRQLALPKPTFRIISCKLATLQSRIYSGVAARFLAETKETPQDRDALREWRRARAIRLLQIATNPNLLRQRCEEFLLPPMPIGNLPLRAAIEHYSNYEIPSKVKIACDLANKLCDQGNKVIIWTSFVHNLKILEKQLKHLEPVVIYGAVPFTSSYKEEITREYLISQFKNNVKTKLLLANPAACAESISLHQVCHHAIYLDRTFNCAHYLQSLDRIHRLGLKADQKTHYYILLAKNSIDEIVHTRLKKKMTNMRKIVEDELPGEIDGYWNEDLGKEENIDLGMVEEHIRNLFYKDESKTS